MIFINLMYKSLIIKDKRSTASWELAKLQLDLEGEAHMIQLLKIKNEKCLGKELACYYIIVW